MTETAMISVEVPEYSFEIVDDDEGNPYIVTLVVRTSGTEYKTFLCVPDATVIEGINRAFNREFSKLAAVLKRRKKPSLIAASGVNSDALRTEKRGQQRSSRGSRP